MNAAQTKYLMSRVADILNERLKALEVAYVTPATKPTLQEKWDAVLAGEAVYLDRYLEKCPAGYVDWEDCYDWSHRETPEVRRDGLAEAEEDLRAEAHSVQDRIMLGDSQEAIKLLDAFAAGATT